MKGDAVTRQPEDKRLQAKKNRQPGERGRHAYPHTALQFCRKIGGKFCARKLNFLLQEVGKVSDNICKRANGRRRSQLLMRHGSRQSMTASVRAAAAAEGECFSTFAVQKSLRAQQGQIRELAADA